MVNLNLNCLSHWSEKKFSNDVPPKMERFTDFIFTVECGLNWTVPLRSSSIVILMIFSTAMIFTLPTCAPYIYTYCAKTITFHNELKSKKSSNLGKCDQTKTRIFFYFRSNFAKKIQFSHF